MTSAQSIGLAPKTVTPGAPILAIQPAGQQAEAIASIVAWFRDPHAGQVFRLFGYAGTGKTTLAQYVVDALGIKATTLYAAFSGKAAHVLRGKGCDGASTIHSLIYSPVATSRARLDELRVLFAQADDEMLVEALRAAIAVEERKLDRPRFELQKTSDLEGADLLILDEVSMVNGAIAQDLLSFGTRILCLGDPAQLPPVDGGGYFINEKPNALLTEIHRSAADSPVTRIATAVREAPLGDWNLGVHGPDGHSGRYGAPGNLLDYDQVIVGTNATRWALIQRIRGLLGRTSPEPESGDRIMTLVNSTDAAVLNGQQFTVVTCNPSPEHTEKLELDVLDEDGARRGMTVWRSGFHNLAGEKDAKRHGRSSTAVATFAHAITAHKAQGSQWDRVLVVDESRVFRGMTYKQNLARLGHDVASIEGHVQARRWLYTAVTRAAQQVVIVSRELYA